MTQTPAHNPPSLFRAFEPERQALIDGLSGADISAGRIVSETRRALDRTGARFSQTVSDPGLQKTGLWLIEIVKSGANILDQGSGAEIVWHEVPRTKSKNWIGQTAFFGVAGALMVYGLLEESRTAILSVGILAIMRILDRDNLKVLKRLLPGFGGGDKLEDRSGRALRAEAQLKTNIGGYVSALTEGLKTADHILLRLSEPALETHWREDPRLMTLVQGLLEAGEAKDGDFALKLIGQELESVLAAEGVSKLDYSKKTAKYFDVLPGIGTDETRQAAPALMAGDQVLRRGTVWGPDNG